MHTIRVSLIELAIVEGIAIPSRGDTGAVWAGSAYALAAAYASRRGYAPLPGVPTAGVASCLARGLAPQFGRKLF